MAGLEPAVRSASPMTSRIRMNRNAVTSVGVGPGAVPLCCRVGHAVFPGRARRPAFPIIPPAAG